MGDDLEVGVRKPSCARVKLSSRRAKRRGICFPYRNRTRKARPESASCCLPPGRVVCSCRLPRESPVSKPNDLVQGTLDLLILKMLAVDSMNGWAIAERLKEASSDVLRVSTGSLYPALHKLEQQGWIVAEWRPSENNRRAKFYSLTRAGRKQLQLDSDNWDRLASAISAVMRLREK